MSVSTGSYTGEQETKRGQRQHGNREMYQDFTFTLFFSFTFYLIPLLILILAACTITFLFYQSFEGNPPFYKTTG